MMKSFAFIKSVKLLSLAFLTSVCAPKLHPLLGVAAIHVPMDDIKLGQKMNERPDPDSFSGFLQQLLDVHYLDGSAEGITKQVMHQGRETLSPAQEAGSPENMRFSTA